MPVTSSCRAPAAPTGCRATLSGFISLLTAMFTDCLVSRSLGLYTTVEYDSKGASPSTNVCSGGTRLIRIPYHKFRSVRAYVWPNVLVTVNQHQTIWMLSLYLYIRPRDGWTQQDPEHWDPLHGEGSVSVDVTLTSAWHLVSTFHHFLETQTASKTISSLAFTF